MRSVKLDRDAKRIQNIAQGAAEDFGHLQNDPLSLPARELISLLKTAAADHPSAEAQLLLNWDGVLDQNSGAAALYEIYLEELTSAVVRQIAPPRLWFLARNWTAYQILNVLSHPTQDVFGGNPEDGRNRLMVQSLQSAVAGLTKLEGADSSKWSRGQLHYMQFRHSLSPIVTDLGPMPRSGDGETVGATGYYGESFEQVAGASYREILDTSDWDNSFAVNTPGQSGEPGSPHYSDLLKLWSEGQYFPLRYSRDAVEIVVTDRLELQP